MRFSLIVSDCNHRGEQARRAFAFAQAVHAAGHELTQIFFYADGVGSVAAATDTADWERLAQTSGAELVLCSGSADRFGLETAPAGFIIAGLGALIEAGSSADRVLNFV
jgi:tRNA 2-thiouridine synthesizing protein D